MLKSREKKQSVVRLDPDELDRMTAIQSQLGLSKTGVIRRLIRDFNLESEIVKPVNKFIVDGQISKNIFLQLPIRGSLNLSARRSKYTSKLEIYFTEECFESFGQSLDIIGYAKCPFLLPDGIDGEYQHDILYMSDGKLYRAIEVIDRDYCDAYEKMTISVDEMNYFVHNSREYVRVEECLNQIFVV